MITLLFLINSIRQVPLIETRDMDIRAQARAEQLCKDKQWSHDGYVKSFHGLYHTYVGENLAKGFQNDFQIHIAHIMSKTHRENETNPKFRYIGIGRSCDIVVELFTENKL